jgi:1-deoxy-D-xylulose-5-phosphate reductoisomerase
MKYPAIRGCTGSIGVTTLDLVARFPDGLEAVTLVAGKNLERLAQQVRRVQPKVVSVRNRSAALETLLAANRWVRAQVQSCLPVSRAQRAVG